MSPPRRLFAPVALLLASWGAGATTLPVHIHTVGTEPTLRSYALALADALDSASPAPRIDPADTDAAPALHISLGAAACLDNAHAEGPKLCTLLARSSAEAALATAGPGDLHALVLDQPPHRQLELIRLVLPQTIGVALLHGPDWGARAAEFAASDPGIRVRAESVSPEANMVRALQGLLPGNDALLAVPDPAVYNRLSLQPLLLTSYRARIPMFAFSEGYVQAGALAAVYTAPAELIEETIELAKRLLAAPLSITAGWHYPRSFRVATNHSVARGLGLALPAAAELEAQLRAADAEGAQ